MPANGVDPSQPQNVLDVPEPEVLVRVLGVEQQRKSAQVLLVMDVSGSMGDPAGEITDATKLELARDAAVAALDQFKDSDQVGLRIFTTDIGDVFGETYLDLVPIGAMDEASGPSCASRSRPSSRRTAHALSGHAGRGGADPRQLRSVAHQRRRPPDRWRERRRRPVRRRRSARPVDPDAARRGANAQAVRVFPIAYGDDADTATLRRIAEASNGALYVATNLATINDVFTAVVSNF